MKINRTTDLQIKSLNNKNSTIPENIKLLQNHFLSQESNKLKIKNWMSIKSENGRADEMTRNEILIIKADACQKIITLKIYVTNIFNIFSRSHHYLNSPHFTFIACYSSLLRAHSILFQCILSPSMREHILIIIMTISFKRV